MISPFAFLMALALAIALVIVPGTLFALESHLISTTSNLHRPPRNDVASITPIMGSQQENLFWYVQISDTHISKFSDQGRSDDLLKLCQENIPVIRPDLVLLTGDITDGKAGRGFDSRQYVEEWKRYWEVISSSQVLQQVKWLDLRGNHDVFNVLDAKAPENFFSRYSVQGRNYPYSYMYSHVKSYGMYSFIALDATPSPGMKRPFNFYGHIVKKAAKALLLFTERTAKSNQTFWFAHYPTATIISPNFGLKELIGRSGSMYFCGHLHDLNGFCPALYTLQPQGYLELELADWRDNRALRLVAVDHDIVSFSDFRLGHNLTNSWPLVLVTNPKNSRFLLPHKEPLGRIRTSTHIRVLVFSDAGIKSVNVSINGRFLGLAEPAGLEEFGGLFTLPWQPENYAESELNVIKVVVTDASLRVASQEHGFSVTQKPAWSFGLMSTLVLTPNTYWLIYATVAILIILEAVVLMAIRFGSKSPRVKQRLLNGSWLGRGLWRICQSNLIFYLKIGELCYEVCGPIFFGQLLTNHFGTMFLFGAIVNGSLQSSGVIGAYHFLYQLFVKFPMFVSLLWLAGSKTRLKVLVEDTENEPLAPSHEPTKRSRFHFVLPILLVVASGVALFLLMFKWTLSPFGYYVVFTSPGRTGTWLLNLWLLYYAAKRMHVIEFHS